MEKRSANVIIFICSVSMMIIMPTLILISIAHYLFISPNFYSEVLKGSYLLRAFIEGKNDEMNKRIRDEIEEKVRLDEYAILFQRSKERYEKLKDRFEKINKTNEYIRAENSLKEMRRSTFEREGKAFASRKEFEDFREKEIDRLRKVIADIESYRDANEREIEKAERELTEARREMERAQEALEEKNEEAQEIIEKHKGAFAARINDDMRLLMPVFEPIFNEKIIDGTIREQIQQLIDFTSSYQKQKLLGNVYYEKTQNNEKSLRIRLPRIVISLWVDDNQKGKRHLLSDVFVEEMGKVEGLKNRFLFTTIFRLSDTAIAEYLANRFLRDHGVKIHEGIITIPPLVLEGSAAEKFKLIMIFATYGHFIRYIVGAIFLLYIVFIFFSTTWQKALIWLKRILIVPSWIMVFGAIVLVIFSRFVFEWIPYLLPDALLVGFAKNVAYSFAWHVAVPVAGVFFAIAIVGMVLKIFVRKTST